MTQAARVGDTFGHTEALDGLVAGLALGLAASVAIVATGGMALPVVIGIVAVGTAGGGLLGESIGHLLDGPVTGMIAIGSPNVLVNGRPAAMAMLGNGDCAWHTPAVPIATGSKRVLINGFPAARIGDKLVCSAVIREGSPNVLIGGPTGVFLAISPEIPAWVNYALLGVAFADAVASGGVLAAVLGFGGSFLGGMAGSKVAQEMGYGEKGQEVGGLIGGALGGLAGGFAGAKLSNRCWLGHPVDAATGAVMTQHLDIMLPGPLPLRLSRLWMSSSTLDFECGRGWQHSLDLAVWPGASERSWTYRNEEGRLIRFDAPQHGLPALNEAERLQFWIDADGRCRITDFAGIGREFGPALAGGLRRLIRIADSNGNAITLARRGGHQLEAITDSGGRLLPVETDARGRIVAIRAPHPTQNGDQVTLLQLSYDPAGDLVASADPLGHGFRYNYDNHLLVDETLPSGLAYHFRYDDVAAGPAARCISTWGDGSAAIPELYRRDLEYRPMEGRTLVALRGGAREEYRWDRSHAITEIIDALGRRTGRVHDRHGRLTLETRADGAVASTTFDRWGRVTALRGFDGATVTFRHAEVGPGERVTERPLSVQTADGAATRYEWDERLNLTRRWDAAGRERRFLRDASGRTVAIRDGTGVLARYQWTGQGLLCGECDEAGVSRMQASYDALGRISRIRPAGVAATSFHRDLVGRVVEERRDTGETILCSYDAQGALNAFRDALGHETRWRYDALPVPSERTAADGSTLRYAYDGDLNLVRLENEKGETYALDYDAVDQLVGERGFDGRQRRYRYDRAGFLSASEDADETTVRYRRDGAGRLLEARFDDNSCNSYAYDPVGRLTGAENGWGALAFTYDPSGVLLSERQGTHTLTHELDPRGRRVATVLPDGRRIETEWASHGVGAVRFDGRVVAQFERDVIGRETRRVSGEIVTVSQYDPQGRLSHQLGARVHRAVLIERSYRYDAADQLSELDDLASGRSGFDYDARGRLSAVTGVATERFAFDPANNLLDPEGGNTPGNRLAFRGDRHFTYDARGNRVGERRGAGGKVQRRYSYTPENQLAEMTEHGRLGTLQARYSYDALGRRVRKHVLRDAVLAANDDAASATEPKLRSEEERRFLWLGNVLLAEGPRDASLLTIYLHEPGNFRPLALIRAGEINHYHLDHLGTPQEVTNDRG